MRSVIRLAGIAAVLLALVLLAGPAAAAPRGPGPRVPQLVVWKWQGTATTTLVTDQNRPPCEHTTGRGEFTQQVAGDTSYFAGSADALTTIDGGAPTGSYAFQTLLLDSRGHCNGHVEGHTTGVVHEAQFIHIENVGFDARDTQTGVISYHWSIGMNVSFETVETDAGGQSRTSQVGFWTPPVRPEVSGQVSPSDTERTVEATWFHADSGTTAHTKLTLTTSSCGAAASQVRRLVGGSGATSAVQPAAADESCLAIDSPGKNANVALTDPRFIEPYHSKKPQERERAPAEKSLIVTGTITCGCPVEVNSVPATVDGTKWRVVLPRVKPGKITLTATAGKAKVSQDNTLLELRIVDPAENSAQPITTDPHLPDISAHAVVDGLPVPGPTSLTWTMKTFSNSRSRGGWSAQSADVAEGTAALADAWHPAYTKFAGGWARLVVSANLPGVDGTVTSDPRWFDMPGTNPSAGDIVTYAATKVHAPDVPVLSHIFCHGSTYTMFAPDPDPAGAARSHLGAAEPASTAIPADWAPNPSPLRPLFGGLPAGIGIAQKDPASWPDQQWNWQANVDAGITEWNSDIAGSQRHVPADEHRRVAGELDKALADVHNGAVHLSVTDAKLPVTPTVSDVTPDQHTLDAIARYNAGAGSIGIYKFDMHFQVGADKRTVQQIGSAAWIHRHDSNLTYVNQVVHCPNAQGAALALADPANEFGTLDTNTVYVVAAPGEPVDVVRTNLAPDAPVNIELHSRPTPLGTYRADASGTVHARINIPASTPTGNHTLTISDGDPSDRATIKVFVVSASPTDGGITSGAAGGPAAGPDVATTGTDIQTQAEIAVMMLALGVAIQLWARRSNARRRGSHRRG
jgi:hypothetical protein